MSLLVNINFYGDINEKHLSSLKLKDFQKISRTTSADRKSRNGKYKYIIAKLSKEDNTGEKKGGYVESKEKLQEIEFPKSSGSKFVTNIKLR